MELPFLVLFTLAGMLWLPDIVIAPYEWFIWLTYPLLILLEGGAFLFLILSFGQYLASLIAYSERKDSFKNRAAFDSDDEQDDDDYDDETVRCFSLKII